MIKVALQEENGAESQVISRKCAKLNRRHQMGGGSGKNRRVRQVGVGGDENDDSEYAFGVLGGADNPENGKFLCR